MACLPCRKEYTIAFWRGAVVMVAAIVDLTPDRQRWVYSETGRQARQEADRQMKQAPTPGTTGGRRPTLRSP